MVEKIIEQEMVEVNCDCDICFTGKLGMIAIFLSPNKSWTKTFCLGFTLGHQITKLWIQTKMQRKEEQRRRLLVTSQHTCKQIPKPLSVYHYEKHNSLSSPSGRLLTKLMYSIILVMSIILHVPFNNYRNEDFTICYGL